VLGLDLAPAARAVELDDADPLAIGREGVLALDDRRVDLARVPLGNQQAALVVTAGRAEVTPAVVAVPALGGQVNVDVLADMQPVGHGLSLSWPGRRRAGAGRRRRGRRASASTRRR